MIADRIENLHHYLGIHPGLDLAINEIQKGSLHSLPNGRTDIKGNQVFVNLMDTQLSNQGRWEAHREYIDLQLVMEHEETIAWAPLSDVPGFNAYDPGRDIMQSDDPGMGTAVHLKTGMFGLFFPEDAHKPGLGQGQGRKAVFKIQVRLPKPPYTGLLHHLGSQGLETRRLVIRPYRLQDAQAMFDNWCSDTRVSHFVTWEPHPDVMFTQNLIEEWVEEYQSPANYHWGIEVDGRLVGDIAAVSLSEKHQSCEIGYCLAYDCWNQGIMTEALVEVMRFLFEDVGFHRITLRHLGKNPASGRVMEKAGLMIEGVQRQAFRDRDGTFDDLIIYGALGEEWLKSQA